MPVFNSPAQVSLARPACVTMGNFDGVHLGHRFLISQAMERAKKYNLEFLPVTFWPHPRSVISPHISHCCLTTRQEKFELLYGLGIKNILEIPFTRQLSRLMPEKFAKTWLLPLNLSQVVIGHDFSFGHNRSGSLEVLTNLGKKYNFTVTRSKALDMDGSTISSSLLRHDIASGDVKTAQKLLGRPYSICGRVIHGFARGRTFGYPTANLDYQDKLLPAKGVYAAYLHAGGQKYNAVTNIGSNPTFNGDKITVESFILNADIDLYDQNICIEFLDRLRDEKKFANAQELTEQIAKDIAIAKEITEKD